MWDHVENGMERDQEIQLRNPLKKPQREMMRGRLKAASGGHGEGQISRQVKNSMILHRKENLGVKGMCPIASNTQT